MRDQDKEYKPADRTVDYDMERPELEAQNSRVEERDMTREDYEVEDSERAEEIFDHEETDTADEPVNVRVVGPLPVGKNNVQGNLGSYTVTDDRAVKLLGYDANRKRAVIAVPVGIGSGVLLLQDENMISDFAFEIGGNNVDSIEITAPDAVWAISPEGEGPVRVSVLHEWFKHE